MANTALRLVIATIALFGFWIGLLSGGPLTVSIGAALLKAVVGG